MGLTYASDLDRLQVFLEQLPLTGSDERFEIVMKNIHDQLRRDYYYILGLEDIKSIEHNLKYATRLIKEYEEVVQNGWCSFEQLLDNAPSFSSLLYFTLGQALSENEYLRTLHHAEPDYISIGQGVALQEDTSVDFLKKVIALNPNPATVALHFLIMCKDEEALTQVELFSTLPPLSQLALQCIDTHWAEKRVIKACFESFGHRYKSNEWILSELMNRAMNLKTLVQLDLLLQTPGGEVVCESIVGSFDHLSEVVEIAENILK